MLYTTRGDINTLLSENIVTLGGDILASQRFEGAYSNKWYTYNYDIRGSVSAILAPDGSLTTNYIYESFGKVSGGGSFNNEVQFTGAISDGNGVYYMNARYYNSNTGRFLSQDTYSGNAYEPWTQHLYTYCGNNPANMVDPTGHISRTVFDMGDGTGKGSVVPKPGQSRGGASKPPKLSANEADNSPEAYDYYLNYIHPFTPYGEDPVSGWDAWADEYYGESDSDKNWKKFYGTLGSALPFSSAYDLATGTDLYGNQSSRLIALLCLGLEVTPADEVADAAKIGKGMGFDSFRALKKYLGSPGKGSEWHHIVEQSQIGRSSFSTQMINNIDNIISVPSDIHRKISGYFNSIDPRLSSTLRVRDWLANQRFSFKAQFEFGMDALKRFWGTK